MSRPSPIRVQLATLADAARMNLLVSSELMRRLAQDPEAVDDQCVRATILTNQHLQHLLDSAPSLATLGG